MENKIEEFLLKNFKYYETGHSFQDYEKHLKRSEEMLKEFQSSLNYALGNNTSEEVAKDLINSMREGMINRKKIDTPYLTMTEPNKTIQNGK